MSFGTRTVAQRDVEFNVNLGQFRAQLGEADVIYKRSTGAMSTDALRLTVKQYELSKAVEKYGAESVQAARKTIALREETEKLGVQSVATRDRILSEERALGRATRGAIAGSGAFRGLGRSLAFSSAAFLGGAGLVYALRSSIKAAEDMQVAQGQLQVALKDSNLSWAANKAHIEAALAAQVKTTAFTQDELTGSLGTFVRRFGDVNRALRANAIAADVARAKNISLADAAALVSRASFGNPRSLRILQIELTKTSTNMDALRATTKHASAEQVAAAKAADLQANELRALDATAARYHGNAAKYLTTSAGRQALFTAEVRKTEEAIGALLLPSLDKYLTRLTDWLAKGKNQAKIQHDVKETAHALGIALHTLLALIAPLTNGFKLLGKAVGGTEHELELLTTVALGLAGRKALIRGGILGIGTAATTAEGEVAALRGGLLGLGGPEVLLALAAAYDALLLINDEMSHHTKGHAQTGGSAKLNTEVFEQHGKYYERITVGRNVVTKEVTKAQADATLGTGGTPGGADRSNHPGIQGPGVGVSRTHRGGHGGAGRGLILGLTEAQQTALKRAEGTKGTADDRAALDAQLAILNRLLLQHGLNPGQLNSLLDQRNSVLSQIDSLNGLATSAEKKKLTEAKRAAAERKKIKAEHAKALVALLRHDESALQLAVKQALLTSTTNDDVAALKKLEKFYDKEAKDPRLTRAMRDVFKAKAAGEKLALQKLELGAKGDAAANIREFLSEFNNVVLSYANNYGANPVTRTRPNVTVNQNFNAPTTDRHREARYAYHAMRAAFD